MSKKLWSFQTSHRTLNGAHSLFHELARQKDPSFMDKVTSIVNQLATKYLVQYVVP